MIANYHTHTYRCRHAEGKEREYIEKAISRGIKTLGFSDHTPQIFPGEYYSNFRMRPEETENYFTTLRTLADEYKNDIEIFVGFEAEYYPMIFDKLIAFLSPFKPDYMILGQHFCKNEFDGFYSGSANTDEKVDIYLAQTLEALHTDKFTYIAHPDLVCAPSTEEAFWSDKANTAKIRRYCEEIKAMNIPLEINLLGMSDRRKYPNVKFWQIAAEVGNEVIIGCDAHNPNAVANPSVLAEADVFVKRFGFTPIDKPILRPIA